MRLQRPPKQKRGYILVKLLDEEIQKTKSGIYMPTEITENSFFRKAEVVTAGENSKDYEMQTKEGDIILVKKSLAQMSDLTLTVDDIPHYIIREEQGFYGWPQDEQ
jgi:co-chaperonin GroES (HSP10)